MDAAGERIFASSPASLSIQVANFAGICISKTAAALKSPASAAAASNTSELCWHASAEVIARVDLAERRSSVGQTLGSKVNLPNSIVEVLSSPVHHRQETGGS